VNWQIRYALASFEEKGNSAAEHLGGDVIRVTTPHRPDVLAVITAADMVDHATAVRYLEETQGLDFLCGYRAHCAWDGMAILYLEENHVGWGNFGTLTSAALSGNANSAQHKVYKFSDRLLRQHDRIMKVEREFDRIHHITLRNGKAFRIGMIADYEPTADEVRSLWERFGPVDIVWNINPNGTPQPEATEAGVQLGCKVMKWNELRDHLNRA